jgi:hypothetical protein
MSLSDEQIETPSGDTEAGVGMARSPPASPAASPA